MLGKWQGAAAYDDRRDRRGGNREDIAPTALPSLPPQAGSDLPIYPSTYKSAKFGLKLQCTYKMHVNAGLGRPRESHE